MAEEFVICSRCVMDTTDTDIQFDENGVCNHCRQYKIRVKKDLHYDKKGQQLLESLIQNIKRKGKNKEFDCIIGVSGGVDSTMVAYVAKKQLGLKPLAVHFDNGWDSELAVNNIKKTLNKLDIELYTHVVDWEEFRDLQLSFIKSGFINWEIPSDHAIFALLFIIASKMNIKYILGGSNIVTEGILAKSWVYDHKDWKFIKSVHKQFGRKKLKSYPSYNILKLIYYVFIKRIKYIPILNFVKYNKNEAMDLIQKELGWVYYGGKHYESIYTRFYQSYVLPQKYNVDKRKAHLSTLIMSGHMTREEALEELKKETYLENLMSEDKEYVIKKLGLTHDEFEYLFQLPVKKFSDYPNSKYFYDKLSFFVAYAKTITTYNK